MPLKQDLDGLVKFFLFARWTERLAAALILGGLGVIIAVGLAYIAYAWTGLGVWVEADGWRVIFWGGATAAGGFLVALLTAARGLSPLANHIEVRPARSLGPLWLPLVLVAVGLGACVSWFNRSIIARDVPTFGRPR